MRIVIAGTSGFLGSRLKDFFIKKRYRVFDYRKNLPKNIDVIINLAGPNSLFCEQNPKKGILQRLKINKKIIKIIKKKNVKKYLYISTIHVYRKQSLIDEKSKLNYNNSYSKSHLFSENYIEENLKNICDYKILRLSNCFGYNKDLKSSSWNLLINNIVKNIFINNKIIIYSNKNIKKDFVPINYFLFIINYLIQNSINERIINISSEKTQSIYKISKDIQRLYEKIFKKKIKIKKKFISGDKNIKIKSKMMNKKNNENFNKLYNRDLRELISFCRKKFN